MCSFESLIKLPDLQQNDISVSLGYEEGLIPESIVDLHEVNLSSPVSMQQFCHFSPRTQAKRIPRMNYQIYLPRRSPHDVSVVTEVLGGPHTGFSPSYSTEDTVQDWNSIPKMAHPLLLLICAIGTIPKVMLDRAVQSQSRWNEDGKEYQINSHDASFNRDLMISFQDAGSLRLVLDQLLSLAFIRIERSDNADTVYTSGPADDLLDGNLSYWLEQAFCLFCYIFPRNPLAVIKVWNFG
ncbi:hypothetical protein EJ02DRAFT_492969 [Clathrospora elynae]|uniref:Uncharacterized protein n=1 Tax=Clathrospora elynae TaxID=706981 RepID=A0A6A5SMS2_9PLEO|nr:hypothetical protein EJ02DRAFT_492969 [Clathrospora elynae]